MQTPPLLPECCDGTGRLSASHKQQGLLVTGELKGASTLACYPQAPTALDSLAFLALHETPCNDIHSQKPIQATLNNFSTE